MSDTILLVDRDLEALRVLGEALEGLGHEVARELQAADALEACDRLAPDVAVLDLGMPSMDETSLLTHLARRGVSVVAVLEGEGSDQTAAAAALAGGADRVLVRPPPLDPARVTAELARAAEAARLRRVAALLGAAGSTDARLQQVGSHSPMREVAEQIGSVALADRATVLITGEPGVGKGWVARLIHDLGPRAQAPFLSCSTATGPSLETTLFGVERGARPGADTRRRGILELAGSGTVLLREVGAVPLELQAMLLRVLEARTFRRAGGDRELPVQARLIVTSSENLAEAVEQDRLRGDLHHRLTTQVLQVPPVRDRSPGDRKALIRTIYDRVVERLPAAPPPMAPETMDRLMEHTWPGNAGEIRNVLERAGLLAMGQAALLIEHLPGELRARPGLGDRRHNPVSLEEVEKRQIESALRYHGGNRTRAAKELQISRATLINKIKRYQLTE